MFSANAIVLILGLFVIALVLMLLAPKNEKSVSQAIAIRDRRNGAWRKSQREEWTKK